MAVDVVKFNELVEICIERGAKFYAAMKKWPRALERISFLIEVGGDRAEEFFDCWPEWMTLRKMEKILADAEGTQAPAEDGDDIADGEEAEEVKSAKHEKPAKAFGAQAQIKEQKAKKQAPAEDDFDDEPKAPRAKATKQAPVDDFDDEPAPAPAKRGKKQSVPVGDDFDFDDEPANAKSVAKAKTKTTPEDDFDAEDDFGLDDFD